jgi:hypothetical protein
MGGIQGFPAVPNGEPPFRHETQNMPLCWASAQPGLLQVPLTTLPPHQWRSPAHRLRKLRGGSGAGLAGSLVQSVSVWAG